MSTTIRQIVDAAFAAHDAVPADHEPATAPAAPRSSPEAEAARAVRAQKMLDAIIQKGDLTPRVSTLLLCMLEALVESADRLAALERQPFEYVGAHEQGKSYRRGMFVTHDGSIWHCNEATTARPGEGPAWTLAVKRGKEAR